MREDFQANRLKALNVLEDLKRIAYSGLSCEEYDMLKSAYLFIKMEYALMEQEKDHDVRK